MALKLEEQKVDEGKRVLKLVGSVDQNTYERLEDYLTKAFEQGFQIVVLDCSELTYMSSAGIGVVLWAFSRSRKLNAKVVMAGVCKGVLHSLAVLGVEKLIPMAPDVAEALKLAP